MILQQLPNDQGFKSDSNPQGSAPTCVDKMNVRVLIRAPVVDIIYIYIYIWIHVFGPNKRCSCPHVHQLLKESDSSNSARIATGDCSKFYGSARASGEAAGSADFVSRGGWPI